MKHLVATRSQRLGAALVNSMIGVLPFVLPFFASAKSLPQSESPAWLGGAILAMCLGQLMLVHLMQGSPGAFFTGLRVENLDGSKPTFATSLQRATPYLVLVFFTNGEVFHASGIGVLMVLKAGGLLSFGFLFASALVFIANGNQSLLDRLTRTHVVKAHTVKAI